MTDVPSAHFAQVWRSNCLVSDCPLSTVARARLTRLRQARRDSRLQVYAEEDLTQSHFGRRCRQGVRYYLRARRADGAEAAEQLAVRFY